MNYLLNNNLSLKAKGTLSLLLALKESDIKITYESIQHFATDGKDSVHSALQELKKHGYVNIKKVSTGGVFRGNNWFVYKNNYKYE